MKKHQVEIPGDRLDHYLAANNLCTSRSEATKLIRDGYVTVNGKAQKTSYVVNEEDSIVVDSPPLKPTELTPKKVDFEIIFEDKDILVINKPCGLVVHPGAGNYDISLVHGLLHHCKDLSGIGGVERPGIVHRLDKGTSGVIVVAKNDRAHQHLSEQFQNKTVEKEYEALCLGEVEKKEQRLVHLMKRSETNRKKFIVNQKKGKEAISNVSVQKKNSRVSYVSVKIETGRTHQIRVHLSFIGHPIIGDELYGGTKKLKGLNEEQRDYVKSINHPLLHAKKIKFTHPKTNEEMTFSSERPKDFTEALYYFKLQQ